MRLPKEMRQPGALFRPWMVPLVGIGVLLLVLLFFATIPLEDPAHRSLPTAPFLSGEDREELGWWIQLRASGAVFLNGSPVAPGDLESALRDALGRRKASFVGLTAHRNAPWGALRGVLHAAAQCGVTVHLKVRGRDGTGYIRVLPRVGADPVPQQAVRVEAAPPADPEAVRARTEAHYGRGAREEVPVLVLDFEPSGDPDVQAVVSTWECYADADNRVYLRNFR